MDLLGCVLVGVVFCVLVLVLLLGLHSGNSPDCPALLSVVRRRMTEDLYPWKSDEGFIKESENES
jgi:hypothetical protein